MTLPTLRISGGPTLRHATVTLDGNEIPGLTRANISMDPSDVTHLTLEIAVGTVEIDAETITEIIARFDPATGVSRLP